MMKKKTFAMVVLFAGMIIFLSIFAMRPATESAAQTMPAAAETPNASETVFPPTGLKIPPKDIKPNSVLPSNLLSLLEKRKTETPGISDMELAELGTKLIAEIGFDYDIDLLPLVEKNSKSPRRREIADEAGWKYLAVSQPLVLTNGSKKAFEFFPPEESSCCCGFHYTSIPVARITDKTMTLVVAGKHYEIQRNKPLDVSQQYDLYADVRGRKLLRRWQVPFETAPYGISRDALKLYIDLGWSNLLLEISESGDLKIVTKNAENIISDGKDLNRQETPPKPGEILYKSGDAGLMHYKSGDKNYFVHFSYVCT